MQNSDSAQTKCEIRVTNKGEDVSYAVRLS